MSTRDGVVSTALYAKAQRAGLESEVLRTAHELMNVVSADSAVVLGEPVAGCEVAVYIGTPEQVIELANAQVRARQQGRRFLGMPREEG